MLIKYCKSVDLPIINIVRREEQVKILLELGAEHILDSSSETFEDDLRQISNDLKATGFFDAVAGDLTGQVLKSMPSGSTAYIYGGLSGKSFSLSPLDSIFYEKTISYFWLPPWLAKLTNEERMQTFGVVVKDLSTGGEIFGSTIVKTFPLSEFEEAIKYANEHASEGKVLLKPNE